MTLRQWLTSFTHGAARLPGWCLEWGQLRRLDDTWWQCPLSAQWNAQYPTQRIGPSWVRTYWRSTLSETDLDQLIQAADYPATRGLTALRAELLAACGVQEEDTL